MASTQRLLIAAALLVLGCCFAGLRLAAAAGPGEQIPASANVVQLNELTFQGRINDGRVWMVEFYADWCRGCRRVASQVDQLADSLAATAPHIVIARLDCGDAEGFCDRTIRIQRTPEFKVYHRGRHAITYRADFYHVDLMLPFISRVAADLAGFELPSAAPPPPAAAAAAAGDGGSAGEAASSRGQQGGGSNKQGTAAADAEAYVYYDDDDDDAEAGAEAAAAPTPAAAAAAGGMVAGVCNGSSHQAADAGGTTGDAEVAAAVPAADDSNPAGADEGEDGESAGDESSSEYEATEAAAERMMEAEGGEAEAGPDEDELIIM